MSRSRRVDPKHFDKVRFALKRNDFPSQQALADDLLMGKDTVTKFFNGKPIDRKNFEEICFRLGLNAKEIAASLIDTDEIPSQLIENAPLIANQPAATPFHCDWGEAPDVSLFYGRTKELNTLEHWITQDHCRLVAILGMGGMGKTSLAVKLAKQIQGEFEYVIWRSLRNAPSAQEVLTDLLQILSNQQEVHLPDSVEDCISRLISYLRAHRCLLILDNVESILRESDRAGQYREGFEAYGYLLRVVGETTHQSCLVLTSREKPKGLSYREGQRSPIRSLPLAGLEVTAGQNVVQIQGSLQGSIKEWNTLVRHYAGNPLALRIIAPSIQDFFQGDLTQFLWFLEQNTLIFDDIRDLLKRQFDRLSELEQEVMYWIAINRESVSLMELQADLVHSVPAGELLETLASLQRRSLLEKTQDGLTQQPVVMEYVTERFIDECHQEIIQQQISLFRSHALIKATVKDYVRETQIQLILKPLLERLLVSLHEKTTIVFYLKQFLDLLRHKSASYTGYAAGNILNLMVYLKVSLNEQDFSQLVITQAYLPRITLQHSNFAQSEFRACVFAETINSVVSLDFSPNGQILATAESDGSLRLWRVSDSRQLAAWKGHDAWIGSVVFSHDGQTLASGSYDQTIRLWDVETGQCLATLNDHTGWVRTIVFTPDDRHLISSSDDQTIRVWDLQTYQCTKILRGQSQIIWRLALSSCGTFLITGSYDSTIKLWNLQTGTCLKSLVGHSKGIGAVDFSLDGKTVLSCSTDQTIKVWDVETGECLNTVFVNFGQIDSAMFNAEQTLLLTGDSDRNLCFWDVKTGTCVRAFQQHSGNILSIAFNPTETICVTGGDDQNIRLWDVSTGNNFKTIQGYKDGVSSIALVPQSNSLISGHYDRMVRLWDLSTGTRCQTFEGHTGRIWSITYNPQERIVISGSSDRTIKVWDIQTGQCLKTLKGHTNWVWYTTFDPKGNLLSSGDGDYVIRIWDTVTGECVRTLQGHQGRVWCLDFSPDGQTLVASSQDQTVKLWNIASGECIATLTDATHKYWLAFYSPDGQTIACGGVDCSIGLWDVKVKRFSRILIGHTQPVWWVSFSPDGQTLVSGSVDQTIRVWDVTTGECLKLLKGHTGAVKSIQFSDDGQTLYSSSEDGTIKVWNLDTEDCLQTLKAPRLYEGMDITGAIGLTAAERATLKALGAMERTC